jgi:hypothetical protein
MPGPLLPVSIMWGGAVPANVPQGIMKAEIWFHVRAGDEIHKARVEVYGLIESPKLTGQDHNRLVPNSVVSIYVPGMGGGDTGKSATTSGMSLA